LRYGILRDNFSAIYCNYNYRSTNASKIDIISISEGEPVDKNVYVITQIHNRFQQCRFLRHQIISKSILSENILFISGRKDDFEFEMPSLNPALLLESLDWRGL
jgi:hypothetical protein